MHNMRKIIMFLLILMFLIAGNIVAYIMSADYRFFLKKIKYRNEVIYEKQEIDDEQRLIIIDNSNSDDTESTKIIANPEWVTFLDALSGDSENVQEYKLPNVTFEELKVLNALGKVFVLRESKETEILFWITDEYPDAFRQYSNAHMSLYMFSSKRYSAVKNIFEILKFDLWIELNEVNNIADASFFINMEDTLDDGLVRIVFEYQNYAFWLKIKKDNYNRTKNALEQLKAQN